MARVSNTDKYPKDEEIKKEDYVIGTESKTGKTRNFTIGEIIDQSTQEIGEYVKRIVFKGEKLPNVGGEVNLPNRTSQFINDGEDGVDKFATKKDVERQTYQFSNLKEVYIYHGLGKIVSVDVIIDSELVIADVEYFSDFNSVTIRLSKEETGLITIK